MGKERVLTIDAVKANTKLAARKEHDYPTRLPSKALFRPERALVRPFGAFVRPFRALFKPLGALFGP